MKGFANPQLLVTPRALVAEVQGPEASRPLVLDLRAADAYAAGHIPGAIQINLWGLSLTDTDPAPLNAFMWMIEHVLQIHGVTAATPVVAYDEQSGVRAARAFWFLEHFGHPSVRVLDGGFGAWTRGGLAVTRDAAPATVTDWKGSRDARTIATWREVKAAIGQPGSVILDARTDGEYCGTTVRAARGGAVPGAVHIEWTENLGPDGAFKPASELKKMYEDAGVTPDREVITYCQGGYRAAHSYLALRLIGFPRVRNYIGSWKEWGDRVDLPVEIPTGN
jgi:thiosulfate/3-mercaptopyruvate sulfurtransferase